MKNARRIGGILLLLFATVIFIWFKDVSVPVAVSLTVVGVALVATSRKRSTKFIPER